MNEERQLVVDLLKETREEINRADSKANLLLTGAGLGVTALVAGLVAGDLNPLDADWVVTLLAALSAICLALGLVATGAAVFPRLGTPSPGHARWFTEIAEHEDTASLAKALRTDVPDSERRELQQLLVLSRLVWRKYRLIRAGELVLGLGLLFAGAAAIVDAAIRS